jgi:uncharacterized protein YndB with AHSA1/START domain
MVSYENRYLIVSRVIRAEPRRVWETIIDTEQWPRWGWSVRAVRCRERYIRGGSRGQVQTPIGLWVPFAVVSFEENSWWDWKIGRIQATGHRVRAVAEGQCRLSIEIPWWAPFYMIVCWFALRRVARLVEEERD